MASKRDVSASRPALDGPRNVRRLTSMVLGCYLRRLMPDDPQDSADDARIHFPPELPISARVTDIATAIDRHQVIIVAGATGSGKTTQLPKVALAMGRGLEKIIGVTQPRRIAATSVAARVASELGSPLGTDVG